MEDYHVTIMSEDPNDAYGIEQGDNHQKYGLSVQANNQRDAEEKGVAKFKQEYPNLPIFWVKVFKN